MRSRIHGEYSAGPPIACVRSLTTTQVPFTGYGDRMRRHRRILQKALNSTSVRTYHPMIESEIQGFLKNLTTTPGDFQAHLLRYTAGLTLLILYGHKVTSSDDRFMHLAADSMEIISNKLVTGGGVWLVDVLPFRKPPLFSKAKEAYAMQCAFSQRGSPEPASRRSPSNGANSLRLLLTNLMKHVKRRL